MRNRLVLSLALLIIALCIGAVPAHADGAPPEPDSGNEFLCVQHALAAEGAHQPALALLEMSRVLVTKGACFRDRGWLSSWAAAQDFIADPINYAHAYHSFAAYYLYEQAFTPEQREPLAVAADAALREKIEGRAVPRFHFDSANSTAYWWNMPQACPTIFGFRTISYTDIIEYIPIRYFVVGTTKVC